MLEVSFAGKVYVLVASAHAERLTIFERLPPWSGPLTQAAPYPYEFLVYRGTSGRCDAVRPMQQLGDAESKRRAQQLQSGWSALAEAWPHVNFRWKNMPTNMSACVFAAGAARGGVGAFYYY